MVSQTPTKACVPCRARKTKCDAAATGLPCSGCVSRNCAEKCVIATRKKRRRPGEVAESTTALKPAIQFGQSVQPQNIATSAPGARPLRATSRAWNHSPASSSLHAATPESTDKRQSETQLHYFHILKETIDDGALGDENDKIGTPFHPEDGGHLWRGVPQLDDIDKDYLSKKKVFDLPSKKNLLALIASYFSLVDPYSPIIDKADFVMNFQAGTCSLFLLYAMIAVSSLYVPHDVIAECGFGDRAEAQSTFASRATLIYDFQLEDDPLHFLQGSLLMTRILLEHPTDKDSNYWFYNALRLATKIELYSHLNGIRNDSGGNCAIYSRVAWALYCRQVFHIVSEFRNAMHLNGLPVVELPNVTDWNTERVPHEYHDIVPPTTSQQKTLFIAICKMAAIYGDILSAMAQDPSVNLGELMRPLDSWRLSLATELQLCDQPLNNNLYFLDLIGSSYRYEATLCRLIQRQLRSVDVSKSNAAKQRLRSAMVELDAVIGKILSNDMMKKIPISLMTAMPALLALHLEAALNPSESELVHSMSRISISQTMLALNQLREIPAIKKAIPLFELILSRKNLYTIPNPVDAPQMQNYESEWNRDDTLQRSHEKEAQQSAPVETFDSFVQEFLEYDALGRWDFAQLDFSRKI